MKIAIFTDSFYPQVGGITTALVNQIKALAENGHHLIVFAPKYKGKYRDKADSNELEIKNTKIIRFFSISALVYREQKIAFPNIIKIISILKKFNVDIIHIQTPGPISLIGCISAKVLKKPLIGTYHTLLPEFVMYLSFTKISKLEKLNIKEKLYASDFLANNRLINLFKRRNSNSISKLSRMLQRIRKKHERYKIRKNLLWYLTIKFYNLCDLVIVPSLSMVNELKKRRIKPEVRYISNGLDTCSFRPKISYKTKRVKILHIGRLSFEKNIDIIIKSVSYVIKEYSNVNLTVVGDGPAKKDLERLVKKMRLENNIRFTGYINRTELPKVYSSHDIFVTASTMETQGLVIIEAMASGLPIIGVRKYAIPDVVFHNENGFLVKPGNYRGIARCIIRLVKDENLRKRFGEKSLAISKQHDIRNTSLELENTYKMLISKGNKLFTFHHL